MMHIVRIDCSAIGDWESFHDVFARELGFPDFYGRNMNAWIDCMGDIGANGGVTRLDAQPTDKVVLQLSGFQNLKERCPSVWADLLDCVAVVNGREMEAGEEPMLLLATDS